MKIKLLLLISSISLLNSLNSANNIDLIMKINQKNSTWRAGINERFQGQTLEGVKVLLGSIKPENPSITFKTIKHTPIEDLPENYDLREQFPDCKVISEIRDQGSCGSCWAFSTAEAASDRICIKSNGKYQPEISPLDITSCSEAGGCMGGWPPIALYYMEISGIPTGGLYNTTDTCKPYTFPPCEHLGIPGPYPQCDPGYQETPECTHSCIPEYPKDIKDDLWFASDTYNVDASEESIMAEIYKYGSVVATIDVYEDFAVYKSGVYQHVEGELLGGHAVKIIGWGIENGVKYWIIANSWNTSWGDNGFIKILRGQDEIGIESSICAGTPIIPS